MSFRSVAACEGLVKRHYSLLGWEYHDTCSDDEISTTESGTVKEHTHTHMYIKVLKKMCLNMYLFTL